VINAIVRLDKSTHEAKEQSDQKCHACFLEQQRTSIHRVALYVNPSPLSATASRACMTLLSAVARYTRTVTRLVQYCQHAQPKAALWT
jgi:hypothetical protein